MYNRRIARAAREKTLEDLPSPTPPSIHTNNERVFNNKGMAFTALKKYDDAIACFDNVLTMNPENAEAFLNKGIALIGLMKFNEAIFCFDRILRLNPGNADAFYYKGIALASLNRYEEAIQCYDEAVRINPEHANALNKGDTYTSSKKYEPATPTSTSTEGLLSLAGIKVFA